MLPRRRECLLTETTSLASLWRLRRSAGRDALPWTYTVARAAKPLEAEIDDRQQLFWSATDYHRFPGGRKKLGVLFRLILDDVVASPRVLDVGCGNGSLTFPIATLGCETVLGVDTDAASIAYCEKRNDFRNAHFLVTDGTLREVEGQFDLVVCCEVLEHLADPKPLLAAMREKLAPAGLIFITIPNGYGLREIGGRCERFLSERCGLAEFLAVIRQVLHRFGMVSSEEKYRMHTSNPEQGHVQKFTHRGITRLLHGARLDVSAWRNSFIILTVFYCRSGLSTIERFDSWLADQLPPAFASGWYVCCRADRRPDFAGPARFTEETTQ